MRKIDICIDCGDEFVRTNSKQVRCKYCQKVHALIIARRRRRQKLNRTSKQQVLKPEGCLTTLEWAEKNNVSVDYVRRKIHDGSIKAIKINRYLYVYDD